MQTERWKPYVTQSHWNAFILPPLPECVLVLSPCSHMAKWMKILSSCILLRKLGSSFGREGQEELKMLLLFWELGIFFLSSKQGKTWNWWNPQRGGVGRGMNQTHCSACGQIGKPPWLLQIWLQGDFKYRVATTFFFLPSVKIFSYFLN